MTDAMLELAEARLQEYLNAEAKVLAGLIAEIGARRLTLAHLGEIRHGVEIWNQKVQIARLQAGLRRRTTGVPT